jgi:hypothetical protein
MTKEKCEVTAHDEASPVTLYQTASQHWAHAEQVRWTSLYNFLMAVTLLLLAWAAIYSGGHSNTIPRKLTLSLFAGAGCLTSVLWIGLSERASGFVAAYTECARKLELLLSVDLQGPFQVAYLHRKHISGIASLAQSRRVALIVPAIFTILFLVLFVISIFA